MFLLNGLASRFGVIISILVSQFMLSACGGELPATEQRTQAQSQTPRDEKDHGTAVASNGNLALWTWPKVINGVQEIQAQFTDASGNPLSAAYRVSANNGRNKSSVSVAAGADGKFLVVYAQDEATGVTVQGVVLRLPSSGVTIFAKTWFAIETLANGSFAHPRTTFATNRSKFFVAYTNTAADEGGRIDGRFVSADGSLESRFIVASVTQIQQIQPTVRRVVESEVSYAPSTGVILTTMESFGLGSEFIWAATIASGANTAQAAMELAVMDAADVVYNPTNNKFVVAMLDDFLVDGGISIATLSPSCQSHLPGTCQLLASAPNIVKPRAGENFTTISASALGSGLLVTTASWSTSPAIDTFFFDASFKLLRTQNLIRSRDAVISSGSSAELVSGTRSVASYTLKDPGGSLRPFFIASPPSNFVTQGVL